MTIEAFIEQAIREDVGVGDHSALSTIPASAQGKSRLIVKEKGVIAGIDLAIRIFKQFDPSIEVEVLIKDGTAVKVGDIAFHASGPARSLLTIERLVLNMMQRMSGIASITRAFVIEMGDSPTKILDTRKTTPNLRIFEKQAVKLGGAHNHRMGLYDMIMIKDNHIDFCGSIPAAIDSCHKYITANKLDIKIEIETRSLSEVETVLKHGKIDRIMLDNFSVEDIKKAIKQIGSRFETELSGNITLETLPKYRDLGADYISSGQITHSAGCLDLSLKAF